MEFLIFSLASCVAVATVGLLVALSIRLQDWAGEKVCDMNGISAAPAVRAFWLQGQIERLSIKLIGVGALAGITLFLAFYLASH